MWHAWAAVACLPAAAVGVLSENRVRSSGRTPEARAKEPLDYHEFELDPPKPDDPLPALVRAARDVRRLYPAVMEKGDEPATVK